ASVFSRVVTVLEHLDWHLDETAGDGALTPNVLADTLEQSFNRRQTGTYYTGRDVAAYIARSTILPWLLDELAAAGPELLGPDGRGWQYLCDHAGGIRTAEDLVTRNLNAEHFLLTLVAQDNSGRLSRTLHDTLRRLTVLDPTCGCGDFLL